MAIVVVGAVFVDVKGFPEDQYIPTGRNAGKVEIAQAVETLFGVKVEKVNTINVKPKTKRVRYVAGQTRSWKKAIVTVAEGDSIELFAQQSAE